MDIDKLKAQNTSLLKVVDNLRNQIKRLKNTETGRELIRLQETDKYLRGALDALREVRVLDDEHEITVLNKRVKDLIADNLDMRSNPADPEGEISRLREMAKDLALQVQTLWASNDNLLEEIVALGGEGGDDNGDKA